MTNFTKGPWQVCLDGSIGSIETIDGIAIGQAMQVHPLREDMSQSERRANAYLMAAAPDLLEACQMMLCCMRLVDWDGDPAALKAAVAIFKATGEQA